MSEDEYYRLLKALSGKHYPQSELGHDSELIQRLEKEFFNAMYHAKNFNEAKRAFEDSQRFREFAEKFDPELIERTRESLEKAGMLDALDEGFPIVLRNFRASSVPDEDRQFLFNAGFTEDEIEVLILLASEVGAKMWQRNVKPSEVFDDAREVTRRSIEIIVKSGPTDIAPKKKRKILNGIGKVLGGSVAATGNVLLLAGTLAAPNPATGAGAIASSAVAITAIFGGLGDLRGE